MFDLDSYLNDLISNCRATFGARLLYVGLQGSWLRGEAHESSDIDVMVILDRFREILKTIGFYERSCGFICSRDELLRRNPLEVCQLRHTTKDLFGVLTDYLPSASREDEINYVKLCLGNLYHELCHRYIHADRERNVAAFRGTCKGAFFLMQNLHYLESGRFILTKKNSRKLFQRKTGGCWNWRNCRTDLISSRLSLSCLPGAREPLRAWIILGE